MIFLKIKKQIPQLKKKNLKKSLEKYQKNE